MTTPTPWKWGTGDNCHNIYDANGALVCQVFENLDDRFMIVEAVNKLAMEKEYAKFNRKGGDARDTG